MKKYHKANEKLHVVFFFSIYITDEWLTSYYMENA